MKTNTQAKALEMKAKRAAERDMKTAHVQIPDLTLAELTEMKQMDMFGTM